MTASPAVDLDAVIARVAKLLAVEGRTPEEAAAYVEKAHAILAEYDLSIESVENLKADPRTSIRHSQVVEQTTMGKTDSWKADLLEMVAYAFDCRVLWAYESRLSKSGKTYQTDKKAHLVGFGHDLEAAHYTQSFLVGEITRLAKEYVRPMWDAIKADAARRGWSVHDAESHYVAMHGTHPLKAELYFIRGATQTVTTGIRRDVAGRRATEQAQAAANPNAVALHKADAVRDYITRERTGKSYAEYKAEQDARAESWQKEREEAEAKRLARETPAQRRKREEREAREAKKQQERWYRAYVREQRATDQDALYAGQRAGERISIRPGVPGPSTSGRHGIEG